MGIARALDLSTSYLASGFRGAYGLKVGKLGPRPEKTLELYEFEACPYCRKVREALTVLDLDAMIYPCPKGGTRFRPHVIERGGIRMFPYFVDPNTETEMYESADIVAHLFRQYGDGKVPFALRGPLSVATSTLASAWRPTRGIRKQAAHVPEQPLELYSMEASPYCRLVREALCSLELPYLLRNVGKGSDKRQAFAELAGRVMVPYLVDPNTGREMFESGDIVTYLYKTYAE
jgi:glutathione S-transferase